jgi:hypothetical protein
MDIQHNAKYAQMDVAIKPLSMDKL